MKCKQQILSLFLTHEINIISYSDPYVINNFCLVVDVTLVRMADMNESGTIDDQLNNDGSSSDITGSTVEEESNYYQSDEYTEDDGSESDQNESNVVVEMQPKTTESDIENSVRYDASVTEGNDASVTEGNATKESIGKENSKSSESESDENALNVGHVSDGDAAKESLEMQGKETEIDVVQSARQDESIAEVNDTKKQVDNPEGKSDESDNDATKADNAIDSEVDTTKDNVEMKETSTESHIAEGYDSESSDTTFVSDADDEDSGKELEVEERRKYVKRRCERAKSSLDSTAEELSFKIKQEAIHDENYTEQHRRSLSFDEEDWIKTELGETTGLSMYDIAAKEAMKDEYTLNTNTQPAGSQNSPEQGKKNYILKFYK